MFGQAMDHVHQLLTAGRCRPALDPADLNTPGVWITPGTATTDRQDAVSGQVELVLYLVGSSRNGRAAVTALDELLGKVRAAGVHVRDWEAVTVTLPNHNPAGLPGYKATVQLEITQDTQE